jgi:diguanylate cyclase (GGDEF)-like protein
MDSRIGVGRITTLSASFAYNSPVRTVRELRLPWRLICVVVVFAFSVAASLIVNGALSASRAVLIGIAAFSAAWAATVLGDPALVVKRSSGRPVLVGALAAFVALLCATASTSDEARSRTVMAAIAVVISLFLWLYCVMTATRIAAFEASAGAVALLAAAVGLIMLPTRFDTHIGSDSGGLLIATAAPLMAGILIARHTRRALVLSALLAVIAGVLIRQPADLTIWVAVAALLVLLLIADGSVPKPSERATTSFGATDALVLIASGVFLAVYLAFSIGEPVRGFLMGAIGVMVAAASLILALIVSERDEHVAELARLTADIRERARLDPLTELPNRAALDSRLEEEVERAVRYRQPLSVCFIDIDHFKRINDTSGHQVGDQVLRDVSRVVRATIRTPDFVARYGGEEFVVIAPGTWSADAAILGTRIQTAIAENVSKPLGRPVTVSIGIAGVPEHGRDPEALLTVADLALYAAKFGGRNRVEIGFVDAPLVST